MDQLNELATSKRLELQKLLEELISPNKVYFQPPSSYLLTYPCIIYELETIQTIYADSIKYKNKKRYSITVIDNSPDSEIPTKILANFIYCEFDRYFVSDNLNHFVLILYY
jgi:hypothetical protein